MSSLLHKSCANPLTISRALSQAIEPSELTLIAKTHLHPTTFLPGDRSTRSHV